MIYHPAEHRNPALVELEGLPDQLTAGVVVQAFEFHGDIKSIRDQMAVGHIKEDLELRILDHIGPDGHVHDEHEVVVIEDRRSMFSEAVGWAATVLSVSPELAEDASAPGAIFSSSSNWVSSGIVEQYQIDPAKTAIEWHGQINETLSAVPNDPRKVDRLIAHLHFLKIR